MIRWVSAAFFQLPTLGSRARTGWPDGPFDVLLGAHRVVEVLAQEGQPDTEDQPHHDGQDDVAQRLGAEGLRRDGRLLGDGGGALAEQLGGELELAGRALEVGALLPEAPSAAARGGPAPGSRFSTEVPGGAASELES